MNTEELVLVGINGICWAIVYIELIRNVFKDKVCGMPLFALGLNIAWKFIYLIGAVCKCIGTITQTLLKKWAITIGTAHF